jgi:hypothetical protein
MSKNLSYGLSLVDLRVEVYVYLCSVEEVDTIVPSSLQALFDNVALLSATIREPSA